MTQTLAGALPASPIPAFSDSLSGTWGFPSPPLFRNDQFGAQSRRCWPAYSHEIEDKVMAKIRG